MTIRLVKDYDSRPEQYKAFLGKEQVASLRLQHGYFSVECPKSGGEEVYSARARDYNVFDESEREYYLTAASFAITSWADKFLGIKQKIFEIS